MKRKEPYLSIVVPVYNGIAFLDRCLNSIFNQDIDPSYFQVVVVDDGSTDDSVKAVQSFQARYSNIILVSQENKGVSVARNNGLMKAMGLFICFLDVDDVLAPRSLEKLNQLKDFSSDIVMLDSYLICEGELTNRYPFPQHLNGLSLSGIDMAYAYDKASVAGVIFRRDFLIGHEIEFAAGLANGEDLLFLAHTLLFADIVVHWPFQFYLIYKTEDSASQVYNYERLRRNLQIGISFLEKLQKKVEFDYDRRILLFFSAYRFISYGVWFFIQTKHYRSFNEVKVIVTQSSLMPIPVVKRFGAKRLKMRLLNMSFLVFTIFVLLKNKKS